MILLIGIISASIAVWSVIFLRWNKRQPALPYRERNPVMMRGAVVLVSGLVWFGMRGIIGIWVGVSTEPSLLHVQASCLSNGLTLLFLWPLLKVFHGREFDDLGLRFSEPAEEVINGVLACVAAFLPVLIVLAATSFLRDPSRQHAFLRLLLEDQRIETILWITIAVTLFAPFTEELLFRVILQGSLQTRVSPPLAIGLTALAFSTVHGWPDSLGLLPLAVILGYVFHRRNSYLAVVVLHSLFNLANLLMALMSV